MRCKKHDLELNLVSCPDGRPGCAVAHFSCPKCKGEKAEREVFEALQQANGLHDGS